MAGLKDLKEASGVSEAGVKAVLKAIEVIVTSGDRVELRGFGVFKKVTRKARAGRNPRTGEALALPEREVMIFKASKK